MNRLEAQMMLDVVAICRHVAYLAVLAVMENDGDADAAAGRLDELSPEIVMPDEFPTLTVAAQAIREASATRENGIDPEAEAA